jgi:hypothetical protein
VVDAIVCAWVGIAVLEGRAEPFGDDDAAIWIPKDTMPAGLPGDLARADFSPRVGQLDRKYRFCGESSALDPDKSRWSR